MISVDTSSVFGHSAPCERSIDIKLDYIDFQGGLRFMRQFIDELDNVCQGKTSRSSDPATRIKRMAIFLAAQPDGLQRISSSDQEQYFKNPARFRTKK
jgi:hypothetical protein